MVAVDKAAQEVAAAAVYAVAEEVDRIFDQTVPVAEALCVGVGPWQGVPTGSVLIQR